MDGGVSVTVYLLRDSDKRRREKGIFPSTKASGHLEE
jgi:hypothetical protein